MLYLCYGIKMYYVNIIGRELFMMKTTKKISAAVGGVLSSALLASMMVAPAFADDPTYRENPGTYTETVEFSEGATEFKTEALVDTIFHYLDYSPVIDVTYSWNEKLEWTYIGKGQTGVWVKTGSVEQMLDSIKRLAGVEGNTLEEVVLDSEKWANIVSALGHFDGQEPNCRIMHFRNNANEEVNVSFQEQRKTLSETRSENVVRDTATIGGPIEGVTQRYLDYRLMRPIPGANSTSTTTLRKYGDMDHNWTIGVGTSVVTTLGTPNNELRVGITPRPDFRPSDYAPWIPENKRFNNDFGHPVPTSLKLIFTKVD